MENTKIFNIGSIHDIAVGEGVCMMVDDKRVVILRETYGKFYALKDDHFDWIDSLSTGRIEDGKLRFSCGHSVDLHTGQYDNTEHFMHTLNSWVENGFVFLEMHEDNNFSGRNFSPNRVSFLV